MLQAQLKNLTQNITLAIDGTSQTIVFFWTQSHTRWKDRRASAHAPITDKSSARTRQTAQQRVKWLTHTVSLYWPAW
jgi:hypothetical protein